MPGIPLHVSGDGDLKMEPLSALQEGMCSLLEEGASQGTYLTQRKESLLVVGKYLGVKDLPATPCKQLLCQGHVHGMKNHFRGQTGTPVKAQPLLTTPHQDECAARKRAER